MPAGMPRINKRYLNPLLGRIAPNLPPAAVVVHVGRRSGREYRTPVLALRTGNSFAIPLPYGNRVDWVRNVLAAGGAGLVRGGKSLRLEAPRIVGEGERNRIPWALQLLARKVDVVLVDLA